MSSSSSSSHKLHIDKIAEILKKKDFRLERIFSEGNLVKYIIFRHVSKGFQFVLYICSKYEVEFVQKYDSINTAIIYEDDEDENTHNDYELLFGSYLDNTYSSLSLNTSVTQLNFKRFMRSVSFNKNYGLFILTQYSLSHVTYNRIRKFKPSASHQKWISTLPVISIEELVNWTTLTVQTLENMVEKLWGLLNDINVKHASTLISLKDSLNTLEQSKTKYDLKNIELKSEYKKLLSLIIDINSKMDKNKVELNSTTNELRKQALEDKLTEFEKQRRLLFKQKSELESEINTYHIFMDEIVYRSHLCLSQLNDLISNISTFM